MTNGTSEIRSHSGLVVWGCTISTVNGVHRHFKRLGMAFLYIILRETDSKILIEFNGRLVRLTIKKDIPKESETFDRTECILSKTYKMIADKPTGKIVTHIVGGNYSKIFKIQKCSSWQARLLYLSNFVCYCVFITNPCCFFRLIKRFFDWRWSYGKCMLILVSRVLRQEWTIKFHPCPYDFFQILLVYFCWLRNALVLCQLLNEVLSMRKFDLEVITCGQFHFLDLVPNNV